MTDASTTMVSVRLPQELVDALDDRAQKLGITRTQWFVNMTSWVLDNTYTIEAHGGTP